MNTYKTQFSVHEGDICPQYRHVTTDRPRQSLRTVLERQRLENNQGNSSGARLLLAIAILSITFAYIASQGV